MNLVSGAMVQANNEQAAIGLNQFAATLNFSRSAVRVVDTKFADEALALSLTSKATVGCDVRFQLVAALRESIAAGTYKVASSDVAEKVLGRLRW